MTDIPLALVPAQTATGSPAWEVRLRGGDPPTLDVWTDYGGRIDWARLFLVWREQTTGSVLDSADYAVPPATRSEGRLAVEVDACPLPDLYVHWTVTVPRPEGVVLQVTLVNRRHELLAIELYAISALRLRAETLVSLPAAAPLRIVSDVLTGSAAPGLSLALGLSGSDAFGLRSSWLPLWSEIVSGQGLGNIISHRPGRERYAALATSPLLKPGESRELRLVQAVASTLDTAQAIARDLLQTP